MSNRKLPPTEKGKGLVPSSDAGKTPALKGTNFRANFQALIATYDAQVKLWDELRSVWLNRNARVDLSREGEIVAYAQALWKRTREGAERCLETTNAVFLMREVNLTSFELSASDYLFWRIVQLVKKTWHDVKMSEEEIADVAENMAERLALEEGISAQAWESIFCEIADTRKKLPLIAEMLEFLKKTKHIAVWQQRLAAVNLDQIQRAGEETVFAFDFKNAVFKEAVLTYVDNHGYTDLAAVMRDEDDEASKRPWYGAIQATAKSEGLSALVTQMEVDDDHGVSYDEVRDILTEKKSVMIEWDLLLKNAQRHLNSDKAFACVDCGAGYDKKQYCKICGKFIVARAEWEQRFEHQQKELQQQYKLESNLEAEQREEREEAHRRFAEERQKAREEAHRHFAEERQNAEERRKIIEALEEEEEEARLVGWHLAKQEQAAKDRFEAWLRSLNLGNYIVDVFHDNDIDEMMLPRLTDANLKDIGIASLGHRLKLLDAIAARSNETQFDGMYDDDGQLKS